MTVYDSFTAWINSILSCMRGCLGHGAKQGCPLNTTDPTRLEGTRIMEKPNYSEDFWGTTTGDIDNPIGLSQRSISSLSTSNTSFYSDLGSASTNSRNEFVNHGLLLWNQIRQQWIGAASTHQSHRARGPTISLDATYDSLLTSKERFHRPIPLSGMVEFLVDVWEIEGLHD